MGMVGMGVLVMEGVLVGMEWVWAGCYNIGMLNLGSSKVSRSPRQIINRSVEAITAYSCELYI